jgi:hypothetical protein
MLPEAHLGLVLLILHMTISSINSLSKLAILVIGAPHGVVGKAGLVP